MANNKKQPRGRELRAPTQRMEFNGRMYEVRFDMNAFRIAENVFEEYYHQDVNFAEIALRLTRGKLGAIMAVYYAALVSGGADVSWSDFAQNFKLTDIPGVRDKLTELLADALPDPEPQAGSGPLAESRGTSPASPGTGSGTEP